MKELEALYGAEARRLSRIGDGRGDYAHPVFGEGPDNPAALLIGEAPGGEEAELSRPFVGRAGRQLDAMLARAGVSRGRLYVTNAVKFRPVNVKPKSVSNRTPDAGEIRAGLPLLRAELRLLPVKIAVTLGNTPLKAVLALAGEGVLTVGEVHGRALSIVVDGKEFTLFPQYHPASVIYNRALAETIERDIKALGGYMRGMADWL